MTTKKRIWYDDKDLIDNKNIKRQKTEEASQEELTSTLDDHKRTRRELIEELSTAEDNSDSELEGFLREKLKQHDKTFAQAESSDDQTESSNEGLSYGQSESSNEDSFEDPAESSNEDPESYLSDSFFDDFF